METIPYYTCKKVLETCYNNTMIKIAICDHNEQDAKILAKTIQCRSWDEEVFVTYFSSVDRLKELSLKGNNYDLLFMNIDSSNVNRKINIATEIKTFNLRTLIIYMSACDTLFPKLVHGDPFDFLAKLIKQDEVFAILEKSIKRVKIMREDIYYLYKFNGKVERVNLLHVIQIYSKREKIIIQKEREIRHFRGNLDIVCEEIKQAYPFFIRINQSLSVNSKYIEQYRSNSIVVEGNEIMISRKYKESYKNIRTDC